jgi:hypothetical protein
MGSLMLSQLTLATFLAQSWLRVIVWRRLWMSPVMHNRLSQCRGDMHDQVMLSGRSE